MENGLKKSKRRGSRTHSVLYCFDEYKYPSPASSLLQDRHWATGAELHAHSHHSHITHTHTHEPYTPAHLNSSTISCTSAFSRCILRWPRRSQSYLLPHTVQQSYFHAQVRTHSRLYTLLTRVDDFMHAHTAVHKHREPCFSMLTSFAFSTAALGRDWLGQRG